MEVIRKTTLLYNYLASQYLDIERHLMKVNPETRRAH